MRKTRFSGQYFSLPNLLSYFRFLLIPLIVWLYCFEKQFNAAAWVMAASAATDVIDGWIARRFNMITDWGKIIDPIADKLTQVTICSCLAWRFVPVRYLLFLLVAKEVFLGVVSLVFIKKTDTVVGSVWYGKATTVVLFLVTISLLLVPTMPNPAVIALVAVACGFICC